MLPLLYVSGGEVALGAVWVKCIHGNQVEPAGSEAAHFVKCTFALKEAES